MRALSFVLVVLVLSACGPEDEGERPLPLLEVDAGTPSSSSRDAGPAPKTPIDECREVCPFAREVKVGPRGECVCSL